ncbi:YbgC/FadM family acyl-CoA thioesterase [Erythrobacter rubeus]|uniref:YbgC/FadM family acyl-CoA thioesterase n=1 Tax=Erythrobacter rubeus TaxID=2760803 RepID=A0ABR8KS38_9SPHN|nr:YbgC/FadM family acyl-CoA thioesterase [Erythrobacter rubeus]MBD2840931.1 YbgC/FadM family acyl-CoA thioesterase [Erythrobacter rubeus]
MVEPNFPGGVIDGTRHLYAVRVYYEDTDLSGITYHANYLRWFERARSDLLRLLGIDQRDAIETGDGAYAITEITVKYMQPAKLDDDVVITTASTEIAAASVRMEQVARRGAEILATAQVRAAFLTPEGRPRRQPAPWRAAFQSFMDEEA